MNNRQLSELLDEVLFVFESGGDFEGPMLERIVREEARKLKLTTDERDIEAVAALAYEQLVAAHTDPGEAYCRAAL